MTSTLFTAPRFDELQDLLAAVPAPAGAAESHGILCGRLCAATTLDTRDWLVQVLGEVRGEEGLAAECGAALEALVAETVAQLESAEFAFDLLLPEDEQSLAVRAEALRDWCEGFLFGFGSGGRHDLEGLPGDSRSFIHDLKDICRLDTELPNPEEADEVAYSEIVEYIRAGVRMLREDCRGPMPDPGGRGELH